MEIPMRPDEFRIIIRARADEAGNSARSIPAKVLSQSLNTILGALKAADKEIHPRKLRSEFFISHLGMGSNVYGIHEQRRANSPSLTPSTDLFRNSAFSVYRSEHDRVLERPTIANSLVKVGSALNEDYPATARFTAADLLLDDFFAKQAKRLNDAIKAVKQSAPYFSGNAMGAFDGRLENLDYRGDTWKGHLVLPGGGAQIECIFDREVGENFYNKFGHKRVSISGRAIYTGEGQLPERVEVLSIEQIDLASEARDIRGSLNNVEYRAGWSREHKSFQ